MCSNATALLFHNSLEAKNDEAFQTTPQVLCVHVMTSKRTKNNNQNQMRFDVCVCVLCGCECLSMCEY